MALTDSIARFGASLIESLHTRLELASLEIEEEFGRYANYFILSLIGLFCGIVTVLLLILLILIIFWDNHRELALSALITIFALASVGIFFYLKTAIKNKPRLLAASLGELQNDIAVLRQQSKTPDDSSDTSAPKNRGNREHRGSDVDNEGF
jgi:uncharacterized membrane protein YqjE